VAGIVQGVGFRPFVYALAVHHRLTGSVGNDTSGVFIEVQGGARRLAAFRDALTGQCPPLAVIDSVAVEEIGTRAESGFVIVGSDATGARRTLIAPDTAPCDDCLRELSDPADRRHRYPFINCTNCGPRFTIVTDVPYDRPNTTMAGFPMCAACAREYHDPADRRFHAQPTCCPACGPALHLLTADGTPLDGDPLTRTAALLASGAIVAVKGLGGYHLAADAGDAAAVAALRDRKHREDKPFAVMVPSVEAARLLCHVDDAEAAALSGPDRPIVLLARRDDAPVATAVAPGNRRLGLMLPNTPLHHLLAAAASGPFTLTSGNVSDEPIAYTDDDALARLGTIADYFLIHDRPIHIRTDDSVVRVHAGRPSVLRRSRGHAPAPLPLPVAAARPLLACGAELKNTFCLARGPQAFVSHHIGDLENYETLRSFTTGIAHLGRLFDLVPEVVAHDLHPEYLSTKYAQDLPDVELVAVQHHHAHIAACLADNQETGPVIGVALDGLGYGPDGTLWGGEFLLADLAGYERRGFLDPVPMPGGTRAIKEPWRMAAAHLAHAYDGAPPDDLAVRARNADRWPQITAIARAGVNAPRTSSAGRLFDAVAAIAGIRDTINYEGQAAIELEQRADPGERGAYPAALTTTPPYRLRCADLIRAVADDVRTGVPIETVSSRFHNGLATAVADMCDRLREDTAVSTVALSGGVFQNTLLLTALTTRLAARGFTVLTHHRVPTNDGGISLGQAAVAAARSQRPSSTARPLG
jgi:hydrogenase maturation protein HypF